MGSPLPRPTSDSSPGKPVGQGGSERGPGAGAGDGITQQLLGDN